MQHNLEIIDNWQLDNGFTLAWVKKLPDEQYLKQFNQHLLQGFTVLPWKTSLSDEDKAKHERLQSLLKDRFQIKLALLSEDSMIGWSYGWQINNTDFNVGGSLVLPEYRFKGLYSAMMKRMLEITKAEGFSAVHSKHISTNNPILIAKLKLGFMINGFELDEVMGTLIKMVYHHNEIRRKAAFFRAGKMSEDMLLNNLI